LLLVSPAIRRQGYRIEIRGQLVFELSCEVQTTSSKTQWLIKVEVGDNDIYRLRSGFDSLTKTSAVLSQMQLTTCPLK
jgi:hypothetical protein